MIDTHAHLERCEQGPDAAVINRFLACAYAVGVPGVVGDIEDAAQLSDEAKTAAKSAAAIMGMNNVYYRAIHLMKNPEYGTMPARQSGSGADAYCKPLPKPMPDGATAKTGAKAGAGIGSSPRSTWRRSSFARSLAAVTDQAG